MRHVCLVTNYNYAPYLRECLASVGRQSRRFDLIVIVDDGSTDDSRGVIEEFCRDRDCAVPVFKENGGQLSCFNAALGFIEASDLVFLLDADDLYPPDYLELATDSWAGSDGEFLFSHPVRFRDGAARLPSARTGKEPGYAFSSTSALTRTMYSWIGDVTSCLALRGSLYRALFPYPFERDWITRADDVIIFGASILGAHKLYLAALGVDYRIHAANNFAGKEISPRDKADWRLRHERLFRWYSQKAGVPQAPPLKNVLHEAAIIPKGIRKRLNIPSPAYILFFKVLVVVPMLKILVEDWIGSRNPSPP